MFGSAHCDPETYIVNTRWSRPCYRSCKHIISETTPAFGSSLGRQDLRAREVVVCVLANEKSAARFRLSNACANSVSSLS